MEPYNQNTFQKYLPGRKIQIIAGIIILCFLGYFFIPRITKLISQKMNPQTPRSLTVLVPIGDPTMRDTDGDTLPDWQEIAIGLDPYNQFTKPGVPDLQTFDAIKQKLGPDAFNQAINDITDTDKVSLTIYDTLVKDSIKNDGVTVGATQEITAQELYSYIDAQKKKMKVYSEKDLQIVQNTFETNSAYGKHMREILNAKKGEENDLKKVREYLDGQKTYDDVKFIIEGYRQDIEQLRTMQVPLQIVTTHLAILNSFQQFYESITLYRAETNDDISHIATLSLVQDGMLQMLRNVGYVSMYLSVTLNPTGYSPSDPLNS